MKKSIYSARSAIRDYNKKFIDFQDIQARIRPPQLEQEQQTPQESLDTYLMGQGKPASFSVKSSLAREMGVSNYIGSPEQNNSLMMGLQGRDMNKQANEKITNESNFKEKEFGLKEKELDLKKEEMITNSKVPTADEVAQTLLSKI